MAVWRHKGQVLYDDLVLEFAWCFSHGWTLVIDFWEEDHRGKKWFTTHIKVINYQLDLLLLILIWWSIFLSKFSTGKVIFLPFLFTPYSLWKEVIKCGLYLRRSGCYTPPHWGCSCCINYLELFCMGDFYLLLYLFSYSCLYELIGCFCLIPWIIIQYYYILLLSYFSFGHWELMLDVVCFSTALLSGSIRCSMTILCIFCPSLELAISPRNPGVLN